MKLMFSVKATEVHRYWVEAEQFLWGRRVRKRGWVV
jgi:hypothetical protein